MGKRPFAGFTWGDFAQASRIFWNNGYRTVGEVRDMDPVERGLFLQETKREAIGGRSALSDLRLILEIFSRFEPNGLSRVGNIPLNDVRVGERMEKWAISLPLIGTFVELEQDMVTFFSAQLEVGRAARPPIGPYVVADSSGTYPSPIGSRATRMFLRSNTRFTGRASPCPAILRMRGRISAAWRPSSTSSRS